MMKVSCYSIFGTTKAPFFLPRSVLVHSQKPHPAVQQTYRWHPRVSPHHKHQLGKGAICAHSDLNVATTLIKICGVTPAEDAELAAAAGAHFIGMIMRPKTKRAVAPAVAQAVAAVARRHGAQAVGVFVDARTIEERIFPGP
ncbi:hypothetical protein WJX75_008880 [Coccomyxa subellipsoidea]|uniref:Phosphoribosylanthranilate isomerase n=1 Tax=Coccomyxa subellipsoidea TaxID=248742 RepID=A0ABR2YXN6_9CHLO